MKRNNINIFKIFTPADSLFIVGFLLGLIVAIFFNVMEIRLIGGSVAVLAALRITIIFKERAQYQANERFKPTEKVQFETTQKNDLKAKRVVIEDFGAQFEDEASENEKKVSFDERLISKFSNFAKKKEKSPAEKAKDEPKEIEFNDEASGVKIKIRKKSQAPKEEVKPVIEQEIISPTEINENVELSQETESLIDNNQISELNNDFNEEIIDNNENEVLEYEQPTSLSSILPVKEEPIEQIKPEEIESFKKKKLEYDLSLLIEDEEISAGEPKKEFEYFIQRILKIIRSVTSTRTANFILVNLEKNEMVIVACVTDLPEAITKQKKLPISNDVVSQIITNQKPEILSDINPSAELDLIPYYTRNVGTSSFVGVPVFFGNSVAGIICADTNTIDAYDIITVGFLGHFTKLVSSLMQSYTEKFELVQAEKSLNATKEFRSMISGAKVDASEIFRTAVSSISKVLEYSTLGIVAYDEEYERWMIKAIMTKKQSESYSDFSVDMENSIIKDTILKCKSEIHKLDEIDNIRINKTEPKFEKGYFISVPIKSFKNNFGALYLENKNTSTYNINDVLVLEDIADNAGIALEQLVYNQVVNTQPLVNTNTGILNTVAFNQRLDEEINKANDFNTPLSLFMFRIDNYSSVNHELFSTNYDPIYHHVINIVNRFIKKYDVFGHIDDNTFAVTLIGMTLQNSNNWARRLRSEIASSFMSLNNKRYSITISGGLAECQKQEGLENLLHNTKMVLDIASQKGNNIKTYS
jgi:diguanylate cyclase (GGDEF)-like protein